MSSSLQEVATAVRKKKIYPPRNHEEIFKRFHSLQKSVSRSISRYVFMFSHDPVSRLPPKLSRTERRRRRRNCARFSYAQVAYTVVFRNPGKCVTRRCERESGKRNRVVIRDTRSRAKDSAQVHLSQLSHIERTVFFIFES